MRAVHFCSACGKVQPPVPVDYFTFFGFPLRIRDGHGSPVRAVAMLDD